MQNASGTTSIHRWASVAVAVPHVPTNRETVLTRKSDISLRIRSCGGLLLLLLITLIVVGGYLPPLLNSIPATLLHQQQKPSVNVVVDESSSAQLFRGSFCNYLESRKFSQLLAIHHLKMMIVHFAGTSVENGLWLNFRVWWFSKGTLYSGNYNCHLK